MPSLFRIGGYLVYFWSNENEPIHVHIAKGKPVPNATKFWLTAAGGCIVANMLDIVAAQHQMICDAWKQHFCTDTILYFC